MKHVQLIRYKIEDNLQSWRFDRGSITSYSITWFWLRDFAKDTVKGFHFELFLQNGHATLESHAHIFCLIMSEPFETKHKKNQNTRRIMKTSTLITSLSLCYTIWGPTARGADGSRSLKADVYDHVSLGTRSLSRADASDSPSRKRRSLGVNDDDDLGPLARFLAHDDASDDPLRKRRSLQADDDDDLSPPDRFLAQDDTTDDPSIRSLQADDDDDLSPPDRILAQDDTTDDPSIRSLQADDDDDLSPPDRILAQDDTTDDPSIRSLKADDDDDLSPPARFLAHDDVSDDPSLQRRSLEAENDEPHDVASHQMSSHSRSRRHLRASRRAAP